MTRPYNERRNRQVMVLVERRGMAHKDVAKRLNITIGNIRQILFRIRHRDVTKCNGLIPKT